AADCEPGAELVVPDHLLASVAAFLDLVAHIDKPEPDRAVKQKTVDGIAKPSAHRAGQPEFCQRRVVVEDIVALLGRGEAEIGFSAYNPVAHELIVVAAIRREGDAVGAFL